MSGKELASALALMCASVTLAQPAFAEFIEFAEHADGTLGGNYQELKCAERFQSTCVKGMYPLCDPLSPISTNSFLVRITAQELCINSSQAECDKPIKAMSFKPFLAENFSSAYFDIHEPEAATRITIGFPFSEHPSINYARSTDFPLSKNMYNVSYGECARVQSTGNERQFR